MQESIETQIERVLDKVRPFLNRDGGDVTLLGFKDGTAYLKMSGACEGCLYAEADITAGVEIILVDEVPGVTRVDASGIFPPKEDGKEDRAESKQDTAYEPGEKSGN